LNSKKRKPEHSFSSTEKQTWAIRERKIKAKRNIRKRLSVVQRKNDKSVLSVPDLSTQATVRNVRFRPEADIDASLKYQP